MSDHLGASEEEGILSNRGLVDGRCESRMRDVMLSGVTWCSGQQNCVPCMEDVGDADRLSTL